MLTATCTRWPARSGGAGPKPAAGHVAVAREHRTSYRASPATRTSEGRRGDGSSGDGREPGYSAEAAPFGLPVLAELPELADVLDAAHRADRLMLDVVLGLSDLLASDRVEATTGVDVDHWLAAIARTTRLDRNLLRRLCRVLVRLPALRAATVDRRVSFAQLRALTLALHRSPEVVDGPLDAWLAAALDQLPTDVDPDVIVRQASNALDELLPELLEEQEDDAGYQRSLTIQPDLFGAGGTYHGTEDALGLAILEAATAPRHDQQDRAVGQVRADNLQAYLRHTCEDQPGDDADSTAGNRSPVTGGGPGELAPPRLLLRCDLDSLLDATATPAAILTRLVGGRLRLTSQAARRLIDERGAQVRAIIVDDSEVVGVGRATRVPPGWLADASLAVHDTCTGPLCDRPALGADLDHARPWVPLGQGEAGGTTDIDNVGPLCQATNRAKEAAGWRTNQTSRGTRTWHHPRTGLSLTSVPGTWRPAGLDPPPHHPGSVRHRGREKADPPVRREADGHSGDPGTSNGDNVPF